MADSIFDYTIRVNKEIAKAMKSELKTGAAAMATAKTVMRRSLDETIFKVNDIIIIPEWDENSEQWISMPMSEKGNPVFRCVCEVHNGDNKFVKELFMGTLRKSVRNRETNEFVSVTGTVVELLKGEYMLEDAWKKLAGKKLKVIAITTVPVIKRGYKGDPDRITTSDVLTIDIVE